MRISATFLIALCWVNAVTCRGEDWPQWLGPNRDSVWRETGIVERFPAGGIKPKWRVPVALGYSGPAVADGKVFVMDYLLQSGTVTNSSGRDELQGSERILCVDADDGKILWEYRYPRPYKIAFGGGPRCTPTVSNGKLYALGAEGDLTCLQTDSGELIWQKSLLEDYNAETPYWGCASHPLVVGNLVICLVGGPGQVVVAFDKQTGEEVWRALSAKDPGYCAPVLTEWDGRKRLIVWHSESIECLIPENGTMIWSTPLPPGLGIATAAARPVGRNLFFTSASRVSALLNGSNGEIIWTGNSKTSVGCTISTPMISKGVIYGSDTESGSLIAASAKDGERLWQTPEPIVSGVEQDRTRRRGPKDGTAFIVKQGQRFFLFNDSGELILADLSAQRYKEISRMKVIEPTNSLGTRKVVWSHPAFANRCLFARSDQELVCIDLTRPPDR